MACVLVVCFATLIAFGDDVKGVVKKVDPTKKTITVELDSGGEKTFGVSQDADIYTQAAAKKNKTAPKVTVPGGMDGIREGAAVSMTVVKKGDRETAIAIKVDGAQKKKKKDK
jgi:hypothetical protein